MKKFILSIDNQRGIITVVVLFLLLGVAVLALNTVLNAQMNQASSNNYKYKIQTFYAADGIITLLSQEMIDTCENKYLHDNMNNKDIGAVSAPGYHSYDQSLGVDTLKVKGGDIWGTADTFRYFYYRAKGDVDVSAKVLSLSNSNCWAKGGIMIREKLTNSSKHASVIRPCSTAIGIRLQFRRTDGAISIDSTAAPYLDANWIRIKRTGNTFSAYRSSNGSSWTLIDSRTIAMTDSVYVGMALCSHNPGVQCTGLFSDLEGVVRRSCSDSTLSGINKELPVKFTINEVGDGIFEITSQAYKTKGSEKLPNYVSSLSQSIARKQAQNWQTYAHDSVFVPVTFYDMRSDMSNPEFNIYVAVHAPCPPCTSSSSGLLLPHYIRTDMLTSNRKLIKRNPNPFFRNSFMSSWDPNWYTIDKNARTAKMNAAQPIAKIGASFAFDPTFSWCFNDSMNTWFNPYGDSAGKTGTYTYDYMNNKWSGLKVRPGWNPGPEHNDTEWVTRYWNPANPFANIVMYDTLKFIEDKNNPGVFTFGKDTNDSRWFLSCRDKWSGSGCSLWPHQFMPLQMRGFGFDCPNRYWVSSCGDTTCFRRQNFSFTMEFHRSFTYKAGQTFKFEGDDDVFVFINNQCVLELGGVHDKIAGMVNLDTLGLTEGKSYMLDFFYAERCIYQSDILITTNMLFMTPSRALRSNWKRDYGNVD